MAIQGRYISRSWQQGLAALALLLLLLLLVEPSEYAMMKKVKHQQKPGKVLKHPSSGLTSPLLPPDTKDSVSVLMGTEASGMTCDS